MLIRIASPETRHDPRGVPVPWETLTNRPPIGCRQVITAALNLAQQYYPYCCQNPRIVESLPFL